MTVPSSLFFTKPVMLSLLAWSAVQELRAVLVTVASIRTTGAVLVPEVHALHNAFDLVRNLLLVSTGVVEQ